MVVDCHTHVMEQQHLSDALLHETETAYPGAKLAVRLEDHWSAMAAVERAIVFGIQARATGFWIPNDYVAQYVRSHPEKLIGFASVDPADGGAAEELTRAVRELGLRGVKLGPIYQNVHPHDPRIYRVYRAAADLGIPMLIHQGATYPRNAP